MNIETGHLVDGNLLDEMRKFKEALSEDYEEVPEELTKLAEQKLDGKNEVYLPKEDDLRKEMIKRFGKSKRKTSRRKRK